jgi:hypothetical protein
MNVSIVCTASDNISGVDPIDASFSLATTVLAGVETTNAATGSRVVCNRAGLCVTAGPIGGNMIDRAPPVARARNITVAANTTCTASVTPSAVDAGSSDPFNDPITLSLDATGPFSLGAHPVTLTASDGHGNISTAGAVVTVVDAMPPSVTASLLAVGEVDDAEGRFAVDFRVTDACDQTPFVSAVMTIPPDAASFAAKFERRKTDQISVQFSVAARRIQLKGSDEATVRALLADILSGGGVPVARAQVLRLTLDAEDAGNDGEEKKPFTFNFVGRALVAESAPVLQLVVTGRDHAGNAARAVATPIFARPDAHNE